MAAARIAAVIVTLLCAELSAQLAPQGSVTVQVTDRSGAVVPGARIEIDPSPTKPESGLMTDSQGRAAVDLSTGVHTLSIVALGFSHWTQQIDVQSGVSQLVTAKVEVAEEGDPVTVEATPDMPPPDSPETVFIPHQPLLSLDPLPSRKAKRRW